MLSALLSSTRKSGLPVIMVCLFAWTATLCAQDDDKATDARAKVEKRIEQSQDNKDRLELYKKLEERLSGIKMIGQFTMDGKEDRTPEPEEYHILSAKKMDKGDYWLLSIRIKYGGKDRTISNLPFEIKWAGNTPVITVDRMMIPGMGTFDARVVIRRDKYAGTWAHDSVGGHLFGRIEKLSADELEQSKSTLKDSKDGDSGDDK